MSTAAMPNELTIESVGNHRQDGVGARTLRTADAARLHVVAWKQSALSSANMSDALQNGGSPSTALNALLYWTRRAM